MLRRVRETAPAGLVPLAWTFAALAHLEVASPHTVLVAHVVMDVILVAFAVLSWRDMQEHPVLRAWLAVIVVGAGVTLVGTYALAVDGGETLLRATVFGWLLVPAVALGYTERALSREEAAWVYAAGGVLSAVGALAFLYGSLAGVALALPAIALAGIGQTAGILNAVLQY
ncbi:hypothetical protein [Halorubellus sp. PRR65]|uniref:hypothetical protein n=1 Tax=Halorubellus sp. PRR65 TaxID=3098148 RepID=UPI002B2613AF|nr:hypothetical protein [Halorubellus sp. PRR65]